MPSKSLPPLPPVSERDAAWAAALIDGEGCIGVAHNAQQDVPYLCVTNTCVALLDELVRIFHCGRIRQATCNPRPCFTWRVGSGAASQVLEVVAPHIIAKQNQVLIAQAVHRLNQIPKNVRDRTTQERLWLMGKQCNQGLPLLDAEVALLGFASAI